MNKIIVSPSILSADFANLERDIKRAELAGADWIHVDVMDGHFVPNITIGIPVVKAIRKITGLPLDVHLMIENPDKYIVAFAKAGADIITFHYEATCEDTVHVIDLIKKCNIEAGLAIKPKTTQERLYPYLKDIDMALVMTVEPGFGGQEFMHHCAMKIPKIKERVGENFIIQVDGGINNVTSKICTSLGATSLVAGSYVYGAQDMELAIRNLKNMQ